MSPAEALVRGAGALHLLQIPGMYLTRRILGIPSLLANSAPFQRRLTIAFGIGVISYVVGTGCINLCFTGSVIASDAGRALSLLQACAWSARAVQQRYSLGPCWPAGGRWLHLALSSLYSLLALCYLALSFVLAPIWS